MAVSLGEVQLLAIAMGATYATMAYGFFRPAWKRRLQAAAPVRASREVPQVVDRLWVATQGWVLLALLLGLAWPRAFAASPLSQLPHSTPAIALAGATIMTTGCALVAWASKELGAELAVRIETREGGRLVTSGPYAAVRHPIYTGVFFIVFGTALALAAPLLAAYGLVAVYCARVRALAEEALFVEDSVHGNAYREYARVSGRFFPRRPRSKP